MNFSMNYFINCYFNLLVTPWSKLPKVDCSSCHDCLTKECVQYTTYAAGTLGWAKNFGCPVLVLSFYMNGLNKHTKYMH